MYKHYPGIVSGKYDLRYMYVLKKKHMQNATATIKGNYGVYGTTTVMK